MKKNPTLVLVSLLALSVSACTSTPKRRSKRSEQTTSSLTSGSTGTATSGKSSGGTSTGSSGQDTSGTSGVTSGDITSGTTGGTTGGTTTGGSSTSGGTSGGTTSGTSGTTTGGSSGGTTSSTGGTSGTSTTTGSTSVTPLPPDVQAYYASISDSLMGQDLLDALRSLNNSKQKSLVGYSSMGTSASGAFKYTDYDPSTVRYDENGQPYGTAIVSFYSGNTMTSFNREHVWPNTHGGNKVEDDIHMPRPTIPAENGSRGHSFYVEGMKSNKNEGWDPAMEDFGKEDYRGDSARIIFYCMVASSQLVLVDDQNRSSMTKNNEMGVISDMLSWNLRYPVSDREQRRNSGAQYLQGNRNPFIDHPEYGCRVWGNTNDSTRSICGM